MAASKEFAEYVAGQLTGIGTVTYRKMFGEYGIYCDGKMFGLLCDDQLFVKITEAGRKICPELTEAPPYEGAKPCFLVEDVNSRETLAALVTATCRELPEPEPKKPRKIREAGEKKVQKLNKTAPKLDYKKEYKDLYLPKTRPSVVEVPSMKFLMVDGEGDPNTSAAYQRALELLYGLSFGIKMSKLGKDCPEGYFEYVVPPLEGLWWEKEPKEETDKSRFCWTSMIRQPEFVTEEVVERAKAALEKKQPGLDVEAARLVTWTEGLCVQIMHIGPYDEESVSIAAMKAYAEEMGYVIDLNQHRRHHEIYLGDPRRTRPDRLKTVIRYPVKKER